MELTASTITGLTISNDTILSETEIEDQWSTGATITRIVGDLSIRYATGTTNIIHGAIWLAPTYAGGTLPTLLNADFYERQQVMWTFLRMIDLADDTVHIKIDIRTKRKAQGGKFLLLTIANESANDATFSWHIRTLGLLA